MASTSELSAASVSRAPAEQLLMLCVWQPDDVRSSSVVVLWNSAINDAPCCSSSATSDLTCRIQHCILTMHVNDTKKVKVAHTRLPSIKFRSWSRFFAVSLQVTWVINPVVGCHYFLPGLQLPAQPLRRLLPICCLVNRGTMGVNSLPKTVTRQRHDCNLNPSLLCLSPAR